MFDTFKVNLQEDKKQRLIDDANDYFSIRRKSDGLDYIYYCGVCITTADDAKGNLLERLNELRNTYIEERL